jgi:flavorubredoxin
MATINEIAPDVYRISSYLSDFNLQFSQFLVNDEEPTLMHTGLKAIFPEVRDAVAQIIDPTKLRWIGISHFEADECGSLNQWLELAPQAQTLCTPVGAFVSVNDYSLRPPRTLEHREELSTGKYRFRFLHTPQLPHGWDSGLFFETTNKTLMCADLFHQFGNVEPVTESSVIERSRKTLIDYEASPFPNYIPYTTHTDRLMQELADLKPRTLATMHGSVFVGDGEQALEELAGVIREVMTEKKDKG